MFKMYKKKQHILLFLTTIFISLFFCHDSIALLDEGSDEGLNLVGSGFHSNAEEVDLEPTLVMKLSYKDGVITIKNISPNGKTLRMYKLVFEENGIKKPGYEPQEKYLGEKLGSLSYEEQYEKLVNAMSVYWSKEDLRGVANDLLLPPYFNVTLTTVEDELIDELIYDNLTTLFNYLLPHFGKEGIMHLVYFTALFGDLQTSYQNLKSGESTSIYLRDIFKCNNPSSVLDYKYWFSCSGKFLLYYNIDGRSFWNQVNNLGELNFTVFNYKDLSIKNMSIREFLSTGAAFVIALAIVTVPVTFPVIFVSFIYVSTKWCIWCIFYCTRTPQQFQPVGGVPVQPFIPVGGSPFSRGG